MMTSSVVEQRFRNGSDLMAMRGSSLVPSTVVRSLVCVDGIENYDIAGTLYNIFMPEPIRFTSVYEVIKILDNFFDKISFPQPYYTVRAFDAKPHPTQRRIESEVQQYMSEDVFVSEQGKKATFVVQVQFRQNATWQGTITWTDEKKTQRFRSTLEMIKLMDGALGDGPDSDETCATPMWE